MNNGFHQRHARRGEGDLHPGGSAASVEAIRLLGAPQGRHVLEVGAGIGLTSARLRDAGWRVTAAEPDPVMFEALSKVPGIAAVQSTLAEMTGQRFDAVIAESVLYALEPGSTFGVLAELLRGGGSLVFVDMVWVPGVPSEESARVHDASLRAYGIAVASRAPRTWADWRSSLEGAGFVVRHDARLGQGSPGSSTPTRRTGIYDRLTELPFHLRERWRARAARIRGDALESWLCLAVAP